jgi:deoxycytidylate deaminase
MEITKSHRAYFKAAKAVADMSSDFHKVKIGCVAVYSHRIISSGTNSTKTNPLQKKYNIHRFSVDSGHTLHAETQCLLPLISRKDIDFSRVSLYIYREHKDGTLALSKPCPSCMALIKELGIKKVYYTGNDSYVSEIFI